MSATCPTDRPADLPAAMGASRWLPFVPVLLGAAGVAGLAAPRLWAEYQNNANYEHLPLVLPVALVVLVQRLRRVQPATPSMGVLLLAACLLLGSLLGLVADRVLADEFLLAASLWAGAFGGLLLLVGRPVLRQCLFPFLLLLYALPIPYYAARNLLHIHLQRFAAGSAGGLLDTVGIPCDVSGTTLRIGGEILNVTEACSGLKFVVVLSFAALLAGDWLLPRRPVGRVTLFVSALVVALLANVARLVAGGLVAHRWDMSTAHDFLHGPAVVLLYALAVGCLLMVAQTFGSTFRETAGGAA